MATIKIHAGDFTKGDATVSISPSFLVLIEAWSPGSGFLIVKTNTINKNDIEELSVATEDNVKRIGGTVGWGAVGALALGPVGLLAGLLLGGKGKDVTFVLKLKDGRKMLATANSKIYTKLSTLVF